MQETSTTNHLEFTQEQRRVLTKSQMVMKSLYQTIQQTKQDNGLIKLKDGAGLTATVNDIAENPHNIKIVELEAAQVARVTGETAFVVLNGNYALQAGYSVKKDALAYEASDSEAAKTYVNIIAVKEGNEDSDAIKALVKVLKSDDIKKFIDEKYDGAVIAFE